MTHTSNIHDRILAILKAHPEGIGVNQLRIELDLAADEQQHLDRRIRDLDKQYVIDRVRSGRFTLYILRGKKTAPTITDQGINQTQRARILNSAHGRCQMCGKTVAEDGIKLHIDHKIPQEWGGLSSDDNLWAICSTCNEGKRNFFESIQDSRVRTAMLDPRVHVRLGELLKAFDGDPVPSEYLELVASTHDDWQKRLRELRELGWSFRYIRKQEETGRVHVHYVLDHWEPWPDDPVAAIRVSERAKGKKR